MNDYEYKHRKDAASLICDCFYVDDGLSSVQDEKLLNIEKKTNGMLRIVNKPYTYTDCRHFRGMHYAYQKKIFRFCNYVQR